MTVEAVASMDLTTLFKSCMKTIITRNKAMGVAIPQTKIFPTSSPSSQFYTRAKDIKTNIVSHQNLLADHRKKYLQESEMTDHERNYMEKVVATNLRIIDDNIKTLNLDYEGDEGSKDACECRKNMLSILQLSFQQVNIVFKEMKEKRKKKQKEKENLFRLQRPVGLKKRQSNNSENPSRTPSLSCSKKSLSQDTGESSQPESLGPSSLESQESDHVNHEDSLKQADTVVINHNDTLPSPLHEETNSMLGELSSDERQLLEEENIHLYKDLMSNQEEVKQITRQVVELGQMQDFFSEKVDIQAHQIEKIQETIMTATENVKEGNEQVREAMRKDAGFRVWIMFFLIVMSCTLLFLDWYNG